jgi:cytochrome c oxidase subunit 4
MFRFEPRRNMAGHGSAAEEPEHHVTPLYVYFTVFGALLVLTVVTVGVSMLGLPPVESLVVALLVATLKAAVVALWFMHLITEKSFYSLILVSTVFFMGLFFVVTLVDLASREETVIEETPEYWNLYSEEAASRRASPSASTPASDAPSDVPSEPSGEPAVAPAP